MTPMCDNTIVKLRDGVEIKNHRIVEFLDVYNSNMIFPISNSPPNRLIGL